MKILASVGCVLLCLIVSDAYFDCRRYGMTCQNGNCDWNNGTCICSAGFTGVDCGLNTSQISSNCPNPCVNDGVCFENSLGFGCYCNNDTYTGNLCQYRRAEVQCNGQNVTITVRPYAGFAGLVFIKGSPTDPACGFSEQLMGGMAVYEKTFNLLDGCQATVHNDTPTAGDVTYVRDVMIQYNANRETRLDQVVTTACEHTVANQTQLGSSVPGVDVTQKGNLSTDKTVTQYQPVKMEVQERSGVPATPPIYIGRPLRLYISLKDLGLYKTLKVESCVAFDGTKTKTQLLINNSCPTMGARDVIEGNLVRTNDLSAVIVNFYAFKFIGNANVEFSCSVRACKAGDNKCTPETCNGQANGFGKRRRRGADAAGEATNEETVVTERIVVLDPHTNNVLTEVPKKPEECIFRTEILATIIILAISVLILFVVCFLLALKIMRSRFKVMSSDASSAASYDTSLRFPGKF